MKDTTSSFVSRPSLAPRRSLAVWLAAAGLATSTLACGGSQSGHDGTGSSGGSGGEGKAATATLAPKSGSTVSGVATFTVDASTAKVTVKVDVSGATPGLHAVHIHEHADCSSMDAESAGGHWNPTNKAHGKWGVDPFHLGDIGNIDIGADGRGSLSLTTDLWTVGTGAMNDVVGHSIMVHEKADDFTSQPSGDAGSRLGCGPIKKGD